MIDMLSVLEIAFVLSQILAFLILDPASIPRARTIKDARDIPMQNMGDSILFHLKRTS